MANNPVNWFEIYVQNMERAKGFYESVFNKKLTKIDTSGIEMWGFPANLESFGSSGSLVKMDGFPSGGNSTIVYFSTKDCLTELERVTKNGGRIQKEKMSIGEYGYIALAYDTEGNMFGLHSMA
ncbi:MAG: VOC family protein [Calditrichaceae bacterium]